MLIRLVLAHRETYSRRKRTFYTVHSTIAVNMAVGIQIHQPDGRTVAREDAAHHTWKECIEFAVINTIVLSIFTA